MEEFNKTSETTTAEEAVLPPNPKRKRGRLPKNSAGLLGIDVVAKGKRKNRRGVVESSSLFAPGGTNLNGNKKTWTDPQRPWRDSCLYVITPQTFFNQREDNDWDFFTRKGDDGVAPLPLVSLPTMIIKDERIRIAVRLMIKFQDETCNYKMAFAGGGVGVGGSGSASVSGSVNVVTSSRSQLLTGSATSSSSSFSASASIAAAPTSQKKQQHVNNNNNEVQILSPLWNIDTAFSIPSTTLKIGSSTSTSTSTSTSASTSANTYKETTGEENSSFPSVIYATYSYDLNIIKIHEAIRAKFSCEVKTLSKYKREAENFRKKQNLRGIHGCTIVERREYGRKADELEEKISKIESNEEWFKYVKAAKPLLERYVNVASEEALGIVVIGLGGNSDGGGGVGNDNNHHHHQVPRSFSQGSTNAVEENEEKNKKERLLIIEEYLKIAENYIGIHVVPIQPEVIQCPICNRKQDENMINDDHGTFVCECGRESICVARSATFRDSARIDTGIKNSYEDLANFIKRLDAFEGKQRTPPPSCLYDQLENYFASKPLECGLSPAQIRDLPLDENGKKPGTSIPLLEEALLRTNNSAFYKDVELIAHKFWGWKIADISSSGLRRTLIADYIATQKVYDTIKERESSLNVNLRLYFHLKSRDFPCELSDFKIVSSRDSLEYHSRMFEIMCERTGLKFKPII